MNIKENPKSKYISFRVPPDTKIAFKKVADKLGVKMSDILIEFVEAKIKEEGIKKNELEEYTVKKYTENISFINKEVMNRLVENEIDKTQDLNTPKHYDNTNGTLYKIADERGWNSYLFDIVKRLERAEKKGEFTQDLEKSINVIKLWQNER